MDACRLPCKANTFSQTQGSHWHDWAAVLGYITDLWPMSLSDGFPAAVTGWQGWSEDSESEEQSLLRLYNQRPMELNSGKATTICNQYATTEAKNSNAWGNHSEGFKQIIVKGLRVFLFLICQNRLTESAVCARPWRCLLTTCRAHTTWKSHTPSRKRM